MNGIHEVTGSIPVWSTTSLLSKILELSALRRHSYVVMIAASAITGRGPAAGRRSSMKKTLVGAIVLIGALTTIACGEAMSSMNPTAPSSASTGTSSNQASGARSGADCSADKPADAPTAPVQTPSGAAGGQGCGAGTPKGRP